MGRYYSDLETRSEDQRAQDLAQDLPRQVANAQKNSRGYGDTLQGFDPASINSREALAELPVLRKSALVHAQQSIPPFGGYEAVGMDSIHQVFQSPGPIYEMGQRNTDWWRFARFLSALDIGAGDVVQNTFSYHFTPAGMMFENAASAVGATVFPAGPGQTELQARAAADLGVTTYVGTPDYLNSILSKGDELGLDLSKITKAAVSGGPLFPQLRKTYSDRGIKCLQAYATADLGNVAYETIADDGLVVDEGVIVEIVMPGTGIPVADGEIGEVLVTSLNPDYPLLRFATGDLSSVVSGVSACGRTNMRISGWKGRADQATKVKGMFVRPEQIAQFVARHPEVAKARAEVRHDGRNDHLTLCLETDTEESSEFAQSAQAVLKLRADITLCAKGSLPNDGLVIADLRDF
ncbi:AMP-dependent synthetase [Amylibacter marinus]|uniref:AMP-dependent synthetase n=1 Tax=Amylibacter marinus TaxID=1475483 RepID=A0ABQ5VV59_9RHOB|nr:AMP-binding protein [Amylibacter marinus]GLQ35322.1 AMP-dependent synthetase [Amylibacter marinus]